MTRTRALSVMVAVLFAAATFNVISVINVTSGLGVQQRALAGLASGNRVIAVNAVALAVSANRRALQANAQLQTVKRLINIHLFCTHIDKLAVADRAELAKLHIKGFNVPPIDCPRLERFQSSPAIKP